MKTSHIEFTTEDNLTLPGLLFTPNTKTDHIVIFLHGNGSSSVFYSQHRMNEIAKELTSAGKAFLPFNYRGAGYVKNFSYYENEEKVRVKGGMAYELIKDCILDIDAAIEYAQEQGYKEIYLAGHSTGANKICVYNYYKPKNKVTGYVLIAGGDDVGLYYEEMGKKKFWNAIKRAKAEIKAANNLKLIPKYLAPMYLMTYQSLNDIFNPDELFVF